MALSLELLVSTIADILKVEDSKYPVHKSFKPGIGPFGEPQLVGIIAKELTRQGVRSVTKRSPDLLIQSDWGFEFKIVRPFGDNGKEAENWSVNMTHPYEGNQSLVGDALKLLKLDSVSQKAVFVVGFEHDPAVISLEPLIESFEVITKQVAKVNIGEKIKQKRNGLVHPVHQVLRCVAWEVSR